jgi:SET domain-containing protein
MAKFIIKRARIGRGVFASKDIRKGEFVLSFIGEKFHYNRQPFTESEHIRNHAVQTGPDTWIESPKSPARYINHSCNPNCGIRGLRRLFALKDIKKGEELTWDYSTSEDADWHWKCRCKSKDCRKVIGPWSELPAKVKRKYLRMGIVSRWIVKKNRFKKRN